MPNDPDAGLTVADHGLDDVEQLTDTVVVPVTVERRAAWLMLTCTGATAFWLQVTVPWTTAAEPDLEPVESTVSCTCSGGGGVGFAILTSPRSAAANPSQCCSNVASKLIG